MVHKRLRSGAGVSGDQSVVHDASKTVFIANGEIANHANYEYGT